MEADFVSTTEARHGGPTPPVFPSITWPVPAIARFQPASRPSAPPTTAPSHPDPAAATRRARFAPQIARARDVLSLGRAPRADSGAGASGEWSSSFPATTPAGSDRAQTGKQVARSLRNPEKHGKRRGRPASGATFMALHEKIVLAERTHLPFAVYKIKRRASGVTLEMTVLWHSLAVSGQPL